MNEPAIESAGRLQIVSLDAGASRRDAASRARQDVRVSRPQRGRQDDARSACCWACCKRDDGAMRVLGLDPQREPLELRRRVGYLAEDQTMYGWMRVDEIVRFVAPFYPTWDHDLALRYLRDFELPLRTRIKHLSKGQNVRLGLVLALAHRPELVILDDPALGSIRSCESSSTATSSRICRAKAGPCFTARTCCTRWSRWPTRWRFSTTAESCGRPTRNDCGAT